MLASIEGMVAKTQKAFSILKERVQQAGVAPSPAQMKAQELEREQQVQVRVAQAVDEAKQHASEEKQRLLIDASRQMKEAIKEFNMQTNSKESCWNCGRLATETCSGCNKARYCGTFCQHKDWDRHMKQCSGIKPSRVERPHSNVVLTHAAPSTHRVATTPVVIASPAQPSSTAEVVIMQRVDGHGTEHVTVPITMMRGVGDHTRGVWPGEGVGQATPNTIIN